MQYTYKELKNRYNIEYYTNYRSNTLKCLSDLKTYIESQSTKVVGYGAAAKGMTVINAGDIKLDYIVDDNPLKQDLLCPGSNIPVYGSDKLLEETDLIIVPLAWNFFDEIRARVKSIRPNNDDTFVKYFPKLDTIL
jgi:hypothetical protein